MRTHILLRRYSDIEWWTRGQRPAAWFLTVGRIRASGSILCAKYKEGRLRYGGGWKMLCSAVHGREYTPVALLIPTRAFLRTRDKARPGVENQTSLILTRHARPERIAIAPIARSALSTSFFSLPRVSHRSSFPLFSPEILYRSGNSCLCEVSTSSNIFLSLYA